MRRLHLRRLHVNHWLEVLLLLFFLGLKLLNVVNLNLLVSNLVVQHLPFLVGVLVLRLVRLDVQQLQLAVVVVVANHGHQAVAVVVQVHHLLILALLPHHRVKLVSLLEVLFLLLLTLSRLRLGGLHFGLLIYYVGFIAPLLHCVFSLGLLMWLATWLFSLGWLDCLITLRLNVLNRLGLLDVGVSLNLVRNLIILEDLG